MSVPQPSAGQAPSFKKAPPMDFSKGGAMDFSKLRTMALGTGVSLAKLDPMKDKLEKLNIKDDEDIKKIKELLKTIKENKYEKEKAENADESKEKEGSSILDIRPRRKGAINFDIFMSIKDSVLCTEE